MPRKKVCNFVFNSLEPVELVTPTEAAILQQIKDRLKNCHLCENLSILKPKKKCPSKQKIKNASSGYKIQ